MKIWRPTMDLSWFRTEGNYVSGEQPLAQIAGYPECGPEWYCLRQKWINPTTGAEEWRDIEVID